jgi:hypothetical protein
LDEIVWEEKEACCRRKIVRNSCGTSRWLACLKQLRLFLPLPLADIHQSDTGCFELYEIW